MVHDPGDIAFRFLNYVRHQEEQQQRRRSTEASWSDISSSASGSDPLGYELPGSGQSRAVVCDINQEMLRVGRERAENLDLRAGV